MDFCPKCKSIIVPKKTGGKLSAKCDNCGFLKNNLKRELISNEEMKHSKTKKGIIKNENIFANYKHKCGKCGYGKAEIIDAGVSYSDEDNLIFIRCGKCGFSERVGKAV